LTVPKIKDLVNAPNKKYENMFNVISSQSSATTTATTTATSTSPKYNDYELLPSIPQESMKDELKSFLKKQLQVAASSTDISTLSSFSTY
jgi:hypothetical protein